MRFQNGDVVKIVYAYAYRAYNCKGMIGTIISAGYGQDIVKVQISKTEFIYVPSSVIELVDSDIAVIRELLHL